jgi:hypothetical protein
MENPSGIRQNHAVACQDQGRLMLINHRLSPGKGRWSARTATRSRIVHSSHIVPRILVMSTNTGPVAQRAM